MRDTRTAKVIKSEPADSFDGVFCMSVDNPSVCKFIPIDCASSEFIEWYLASLGLELGDFAEHRIDDDGIDEIWLWTQDHELIDGEKVSISSDVVFGYFLDKKIDKANRELSINLNISKSKILNELDILIEKFNQKVMSFDDPLFLPNSIVFLPSIN